MFFIYGAWSFDQYIYRTKKRNYLNKLGFNDVHKKYKNYIKLK